MKLTIWLKKDKTTLLMYDELRDNIHPVLTGELKDPQILIDPDKKIIEIKEGR